MHIPDGYISPQTAGGLWALMVPAWYAASQRLRRAVSARQAPLVAIGAAFTFVIMMFNIPVPGGTSGHAVGGTLVAIVLGPWAAIISLTVALAIQSLFFGDGGILAIGANCFNIAFALPVTGYFVYRLLAARAAPDAWRRTLAAALGAFAGINMAALLTALEVGVQPALFHAADGTALYSPYSLAQTLPAMMTAHLTVIGFIEAAVTGAAIAWLRRANPQLLASWRGPAAGRPQLRPLLTGLLLLVVFVPLGLLSGATAWGEWSTGEVGASFGLVPAGMQRFAGFWSGLLPGYGKADSPWLTVAGYVASAAIGVAAVGLLALLATRLIGRRRPADDNHGAPARSAGPRPDSPPAWMLRSDARPLPPAGSKARRSSLEGTITGLARVLQESVFSEEAASRPGLLQRLDPRVKLLSLAVLLLAAALVRQPLLLLGLYALTLAAAAASRLSLPFFVRRVWLFIPLFTGIIVVPSIFNVVKAGDPLLTLWDFGHDVMLGPWNLGSSLAITHQGVDGAVLLVLRVAVSVSLAVLLALTTRWPDLLRALRIFRLPRVFILILSMTYRYIFLLLKLATEMFTARRSRSVGAASRAEERRFAAVSAGALLGRSHALSDEVFAAMVSRGYTGEPRSVTLRALRSADFAMAAACLALAALAIGGDRILG